MVLDKLMSKASDIDFEVYPIRYRAENLPHIKVIDEIIEEERAKKKINS